MSIFLLILGLVLFVGLVVVHEFGHFIVARRNGVDVEEFGIGFPPQAWQRKTKKGFIFSINWLPIGGFVRLKGEHEADTKHGSFGAASFGAKSKIMLAGVGMNLLVAFIMLMGLAWVGMPQLVDNQFTVKSDAHVAQRDVLIGFVEGGSPASKAGLKVRDKILAIGTPGHLETITNANQLPDVTKSFAGQTVTINYDRNGDKHTTTTQLLSALAVNTSANTKNPKGYLGISPTEYTLTRSTWSAPVVALGLMGQFTQLTLHGLGTAISALFRGDTTTASAQVSGPVGIVVLLRDGSLLGYQFVLLIIAVISLTLAIMNVLPIPALDGGRFFVMIISRLRGRPLSEIAEDRIYGAGFSLLMLLVVVITIVDVKRYF